MINLKKKRDCCGCSSCVQKCPTHCITLVEDNEGFLYPKIDTSVCINCGLCEKVCPWLNRPEPIEPQKVLAVKNCNEDERMASSSGGVFIALARKIIEKRGVVFGAIFDKDWEVIHVYAETIEGVRPMMGSKYVQSRINNSFRDAEKFLKEGRKVLFTGTPCQIAGLHQFLRKDYPNLLSVDFLCHGVPSPGVWRRYLNETFIYPAQKVTEKNAVMFSSLKSMHKITNINFRDKQQFGWKEFSFVVRGSAYKEDKNSILLSDMHKVNLYMRGFLANIYLRPSCYQCKCKNGISHSDLTIADFWGITQLMPDFDDDKGVGLVLLNTNRGVTEFDRLNMEIMQSTLEVAKRFNGGFKDCIDISLSRKLFYKKFIIGKSINDCISHSLKNSIFRKILNKIYGIVKQLNIK